MISSFSWLYVAEDFNGITMASHWNSWWDWSRDLDYLLGKNKYRYFFPLKDWEQGERKKTEIFVQNLERGKKKKFLPWSKLSFLDVELSPKPSISTRSLLASESFSALRVTSEDKLYECSSYIVIIKMLKIVEVEWEVVSERVKYFFFW